MAKRPEEKIEVDQTSEEVSEKGAFVERLPFRISKEWLDGLILILAVILAYQPVWHAGFVWDDDHNLTSNTNMVGLAGLKEIWTTNAAQFYPLVLTTFWVEHALWGFYPLPYHLVNVLMHAACAIALWRVLASLEIPGAWLGAALWALHPVMVQSVAWITEMTNTQSGLFFLLSIFFYVKWLKAGNGDGETGRGLHYILTLVFAALAMASKSSTVVLPVILCLCAWWIEGRWHWRNVVRISPMFLMSLASGALSIWTVALQDVYTDTYWSRTWPERLVTTGDAIWFYLGKLIWPHPLIMVYPRWQINGGQLISYLPLLAVIVVLGVLWHNRNSWGRPWFFAFAYFLVALFPVAGLFDHYILRFSLVFDHFQYLASMGPMALAGAGLVRFADWAIPGKQEMQSILAAGLLSILGLWSWHRAGVYQNDGTVWSDTLRKNPDCWVAYNDLGVIFNLRGQVGKAVADYKKALALNPNYDDGHNNLGNALLNEGRTEEAISEYQKAIEIRPKSGQFYNNLGNAYNKEGLSDEAIIQYQKAIDLGFDFVEDHYNLGVLLCRKGQIDEAIIQYQKAIELSPKNVKARNNLGIILCNEGRVDEAIAQYQAAVAIDPAVLDIHNNLGSALLKEGKLAQAVAEFQAAMHLNPSNTVVQRNLDKAQAMLHAETGLGK